MAVSYTNRKGVTYYLCQGTTKTGKPRYYFALTPTGAPVEAIPQGLCITESVNGVVSLVKDRPALIQPEEVATVEAALAQHPKGRNYRVGVKGNRIDIYERVGPDIETILTDFADMGLSVSLDLATRFEEDFEQHGQYTAILRFILVDAERRIFRAARFCYLGSVDDWIDIGCGGAVDELARLLVPKLGMEAFFELW